MSEMRWSFTPISAPPASRRWTWISTSPRTSLGAVPGDEVLVRCARCGRPPAAGVEAVSPSGPMSEMRRSSAPTSLAAASRRWAKTSASPSAPGPRRRRPATRRGTRPSRRRRRDGRVLSVEVGVAVGAGRPRSARRCPHLGPRGGEALDEDLLLARGLPSPSPATPPGTRSPAGCRRRSGSVAWKPGSPSGPMSEMRSWPPTGVPRASTRRPQISSSSPAAFPDHTARYWSARGL